MTNCDKSIGMTEQEMREALGLDVAEPAALLPETAIVVEEAAPASKQAKD